MESALTTFPTSTRRWPARPSSGECDGGVVEIPLGGFDSGFGGLDVGFGDLDGILAVVVVLLGDGFAGKLAGDAIEIGLGVGELRLVLLKGCLGLIVECLEGASAR